MIKKIFVLLAFLSIFKIHSQEIFLQKGKNITLYDFKSANGDSDLDFRSRGGDFYELGYNYKIKDSKFSYLASITYNQFNAAASNGVKIYSWETSYLGVQNMITYSFFEFDNEIEIILKAGFNTATIVRGEQFNDLVYYNIKNQEEFSGILLQPILGLNAQYTLTEKIKLSLGYNFSKAFNVSNTSDEKITFNTNQIQFGIYFPL